MTAFARRRRIAGYAVVLGLYALVALVTPLLHHDVACHLQSKSHCDACTASSTASRVESSVGMVGHVGAVEARALGDVTVRACADRPASPGRAPPSRHSTL